MKLLKINGWAAEEERVLKRLKRTWSQLAWLVFLILGALIVGVGVDTFLNPGGRFISQPFDLTWARMIAAMLLGATLLALVFKGWMLITLTSACGIGFILIPLLRSPAGGALLVALWIGLAAYLLGDAALTWLGVRTLAGSDWAALALAIGFAGLMLISTALGFLGLYYPIAAWSVLGSITMILLPRKAPSVWRLLNSDWRGWAIRSSDLRLQAWGLAMILICGFGAYLWALAPAVRWDSLSYHIPVPLHYIRQHAISEMPESLQSYWAHYAETLYTLGMLIKPSTSLPGLLHFEMGLLTTLLAFVLGRKSGGISGGILAAILFWSIPMVQLEAGSAYIDLFSAVFVTALLYTVWTWVEHGDDHWLLISGLFAGMAVGVKLNAAIPVGLVGIFILYHAIRQHTPVRAVWRQALIFGLPALLIAAPWFVRDWAWTGNPVFPNYNQIFHSPKGFETTFFGFEPEMSKVASLSTLPLKLLLKSSNFYHEMPGFALGGLSLLALPLMYPWISGRQKRPILVSIAGFVLLTVVITLQSNANFRYLILIFPAMAVLSSENLLLLWGAFQNPWVKRAALLVALGVGAAYLLVTQLAVVVGQLQIPERFPYRYALGLESGEDLLRRTTPSYSAFRFLEEHAQGPVKILSLGNEFRLYTSAQIYGPLYSKEAYEILHNPANGDGLARLLRASGYTHLLIYQPEVDYRPKVYTASALDNQFLLRYAQPLYAQNQMRIYQLSFDSARLMEASPNLLVNSGFETLTSQGLPAMWELMGHPGVSSLQAHAHSGQVALQIAGPSLSGTSQIVPAEAGKIYTLSYWARPESDGQVLQLFVQWLDGEQKVIAQSAEWAKLKPGWNNYQAPFTAEAGTVNARFLVTTASPGETWVDDLCMTTAAACP